MTRDQLRDAAASMLGFPDYSKARPDQLWIARAVVRAVYKAFQPDDDSRAVWAEKSFGLFMPAPVSLSIGVTQGSSSFTHTDGCPDEKYRGSYVIIGDRYYTYAERTDAANGEFAEPYEGVTGTITAKFYHNSVALDDTVFSVMAHPQMIGHGTLAEISSKRQELELTGLVRNDYIPSNGAAYYNTVSVQSSINTGTPQVYFIDDTMMGSSFARRFVTHPLPDKQFSINARASIAPTIPAAGEVPFPGPADFADVVLIPILEMICSSSKRYSGKNQRELGKEEASAFGLLRRFSRPQKRKNSRVRVRRGY